MSASYWGNTGKYQHAYERLQKLIPVEGQVANPAQNKSLEKLRKAANCYYDLFNNGLCNRAQEFRAVFGFGGRYIADTGFNDTARLDAKMDEIILQAAAEQNVPLTPYWTAHEVAKMLLDGPDLPVSFGHGGDKPKYMLRMFAYTDRVGIE